MFSRYPRRANESEIETRQRVDAQENVLILFREVFELPIGLSLIQTSQGKLREGISSSRRSDVFALEGTRRIN